MPSPRFSHGFENDVLISYCHTDDEPDPSGRRWVSRFEQDLKTLLEQNSGHSVRIWRDQRLDAADRFNEEILDQLRKSAVLIMILTRSYLNSAFCQKEWREFLRISTDLSNTTRLVKVAKTYVPLEEYPKELLETNQHSFFVKEASGQYRQYHLHPDSRYDREYVAHVDDVAQELERILRRLQGPLAYVPSQGTVYVAETSPDLNPERDGLCRILNQLHYDVLPSTSLHGMTAPEIRRAVERDLAASRLAILPIGAYYGPIPELGGDASIIRIQLEVAAGDQRNGNFPRLVWVPKDIQPAEPRQEQLLKEIREKWARRPFEVLEVLPYQLYDVLETRLKSPAPPPTQEGAVGRPERPSVYVLSALDDVEAAQTTRQWLFENDFDVPGPPESWENPAALREEMRRHLAEDHAFLVYYGRANESWVRAQLMEVSKAAGLRRKDTILLRAVFHADPETPNKKRLLLREMVLPGFAPASVAESLAPFAAEVQRRWRAQASGASTGDSA